ncbi:hypothetical protein ACVIWU_007018 [Bradyrhizobium sp. USDA 4509]
MPDASTPCSFAQQQLATPVTAVGTEAMAVEHQGKRRSGMAMLSNDGGSVGVVMLDGDKGPAACFRKAGRCPYWDADHGQ